jgi:hypothetical protein
VWLFEHYRGRPGMLNCPVVCRVTGPVDQRLLERSLTWVTERHESLRTTFEGRGRRLVQVVHPPGDIELTVRDLTRAADPQAALRSALRTELRTSIDVGARSVRTSLWRVRDDEHLLVVNLHHLVADQASCAVLFGDLVTAYRQALGETVAPGEPFWQYRQFASWQQRMIDVGGFQAQSDYWRERLRGTLPIPIPIGPHRPGAGSERTSADASIDGATTARLEALARSSHTTTFAVMLSLFYACVHRATGARDLSIASLFANRARPELRRTVGLLANLVVLRGQIPPDASFLDILRVAHETVAGAFANQGLPYHLVSLPAATGDVRMDEAVFHMLPEGIEQVARAGPVRFEALVPDVTGRFDVEFALMPVASGTAVKLYFTEDRLESALAHRLVDDYVRLAVIVARDADAPVA